MRNWKRRLGFGAIVIACLLILGAAIRYDAAKRAEQDAAKNAANAAKVLDTAQASAPAGSKPATRPRKAATPTAKNTATPPPVETPSDAPNTANRAAVLLADLAQAQMNNRSRKSKPEKPGHITGRVLLDGAPVPNVEVVLKSNVTQQQISQTETGAMGDFEFRNVEPGEVGVVASFHEPTDDVTIGPSRTVNEPVVVEPGQTTPVEFDLQSSHAGIEGAVTVEGKGVPNVDITGWVFTESGVEDIYIDTTPDGHYAANNLPPGHAKIQATVPAENNANRVLSKEVDLIPDEITRLDFDFTNGGVLKGHVENLFPDGNNGLAVYKGHLDLGDPHQMTPEQFYYYHETMTIDVYMRQTDQFHNENVPAGEYTISAYSIPSRAREAAAFREGRYDVQYVTVTDGEENELIFHLK